MPRNKFETFEELYLLFETGGEVSVELQEAAHKHGLNIDRIEDAALASFEDEEYVEE